MTTIGNRLKRRISEADQYREIGLRAGNLGMIDRQWSVDKLQSMVYRRRRSGGVGVGEPGFTVTKKLVLVLLGPSFTVTVIVAAPVCPAAGVTVTVRLAPLPPNTIFRLGISPGLDDAALNCRFAGASPRRPP